MERLAALAGLDPCAARHRAGIAGLAADRATGNSPGAAAHVEGRVTLNQHPLKEQHQQHLQWLQQSFSFDQPKIDCTVPQ